ncbi:Oidioi.mRNA.OKI2018_I69.PAR.g11189.t1.cds [Oikopleura dioica]|uniref:Oidioi.mRNA.OKI2018_I69.PAR.g11189.t1.cds n=1 Tax=Oikopleura dioica TaxID=34765 RepID=A0ABN7RYV8_OIKDI|nr:Oidioi.mRNA.OKI2018_I69.PAR.g11189.t1.cds [Oikopleura dioica]
MVHAQEQSVQETQLAALIFTGAALACMMVVIVNKISCLNEQRRMNQQREEQKNDVEAGRSGGLCSALCLCQTIADVICAPKDKVDRDLDYYDRCYAETVKSMDISESGNDNVSLPREVNAAALATAQFLAAEGNLSSLTSSERSQIAENRQVMKAYLISKLVAPKYRVEDGKINMQKNVGHLDRFEHFHRQEAMFQLVFNGQIAVDTRATKRQQREAIKRLKKSSKDRKLEKQEKIPESEKETSGIGTEVNFPSPSNHQKGAETSNKPISKPPVREKPKRTESGSSASTQNSRRKKTDEYPMFKRLASVVRNKGQDSAVGSSIGQYDADIESIERAKNRPLQGTLQRAQDQSRTSSSDRETKDEDLEPIREETCTKEAVRNIEPRPIFSQSDFTSTSSQSRTVSKNPSETSCDSEESSSSSNTSGSSTITV